MKKTALICGISGQDGSYLARSLLRKGYEVLGTSRDAQMCNLGNLEKLGVKDKIKVVSMAPNDFRSVLQVLTRAEPHEIYNLAGQSSVGLSFDQPVETLESISIGTLNLLEAIRFLGMPTRFYNACSSECFGDANDRPCNELTPFRPRSPYAVAKAAAYWQVANYREAYDLFACSGMLFNHESPLRPERFVTQKVVAAAARISRGSEEKLVLGDLGIKRDWGWAPEYVEAMWLMLQRENPSDFVIATGQTQSLQDFVTAAFDYFDLDWAEFVTSDPGLFRPTELRCGIADPAEAEKVLGWSAKVSTGEVVKKMCGVATGLVDIVDA